MTVPDAVAKAVRNEYAAIAGRVEKLRRREIPADHDEACALRARRHRWVVACGELVEFMHAQGIAVPTLRQKRTQGERVMKVTEGCQAVEQASER